MCDDMRIEVATHANDPTKAKGDLLEILANEILERQHYEVKNEVRRTASELDLACQHKVSKRRLVVECKAQRDPLSANALTLLLGNMHFHAYDEAWLISTGPLGKDAKGFQHDWELKPDSERSRLSIYTPDRIVELLIASQFITHQPTSAAVSLVIDESALGDWVLLITEYGLFWAVPVLESRVPSFALVFDAKSGNVIQDPTILRRIAETDSSLSSLSFESVHAVIQQNTNPTRARSLGVVEVQTGVDWKDYRPARPEHFIGRKDVQDRVLSLLKSVPMKETKTRVFAITGDSGMGKSSLVTKLRDRCQNVRHRGKFYLFAVDVRAAVQSGYVTSALLSALTEAAKEGFGELGGGELRITDHVDPLESPSLQSYFASLEKREQIVCVVFDQFEELYSKPDLFSVFEEAQRLFLATIARCTNLVLGFAWKTDTTVQQGHPAYFMWHRLADHRFEVSLLPFTHKEASSALTLFEKEIGNRIRPELRRQIIEISQGFPWLIKKLCVHIWENLHGGVSQEELADTLEVSGLFDRDLQALTFAENGCLKAIARGAPADWYEILEIYGEEVLRSLQQRRLVVRSGDRLNLYWDIFRDYVLTGTVPSLPFTFLPSSSSLRTLLKVAAQLSHAETVSIEEVIKRTGIVEGTTQNVIHDLIMFGVGKGTARALALDERVKSNDSRQVLMRLRDVLRRHALMLRLAKYDKTEVVSPEQLIEELKATNRAAQHGARTWRIYAERISRWLRATGLLATTPGGIRVIDLGDVQSLKVRNERYGRFLGEAPPHRVIEALLWLGQDSPKSMVEIKTAGHRNSVAVLHRFGIARRSEDDRKITTDPIAASEAADKVWHAAYRDPILIIVVDLLEKTPRANADAIADCLNAVLSVEWNPATKRRVANALRRWAVWLIEGRRTGNTPPVTEIPNFRRTRSMRDRSQRSLFSDDEVPDSLQE